MRHAGLFEPDPLIGELAAGGNQRAGGLPGEKRLMLAVLRSALECYQQHLLAEDRIAREMFEEAAAWFASTESRGLFSFEAIAEALDIEPAYIRRQLAEWTRRRVHDQSPADGRGGSRPSA